MRDIHNADPRLHLAAAFTSLTIPAGHVLTQNQDHEIWGWWIARPGAQEPGHD